MSIITLARIANVRLAEYVWRMPDVRSKLKRFFLDHESHKLSNDNFHEITSQIFECVFLKLQSITLLSDEAKMELLHVASQMGVAIIKWINDMRESRDILDEELDDEVQNDLIDNIYWTDFGSVDCNKIFRSLHSTGKMPHTMLMYFQISELCLVDCIKDMWANSAGKWPNSIELFSDSFFIFSKRCAFYWDYHLRGGALDIPSDIKSKLTDEMMLEMAVVWGGYSCTRYFWNKLASEKKNDLVVKMALEAMRSAADRDVNIAELSLFNYDKFSDIIYFLTEKMTKEQRTALSTEHLRYLYTLLNWPYQDLFLIAFNNIKSHIEDSYKYVLRSVIWKMVDRENSTFTVQKYASILKEVLKSIPDDAEFTKSPHWLIDMIGSAMNNIDCVKLLVTLYKEEIRKQLTPEICCYLVSEDSFESLKFLVAEIFDSDSERCAFKSAINAFKIYNYYVRLENVIVGKKFLSWVFDINQENIDDYLMNMCKEYFKI